MTISGFEVDFAAGPYGAIKAALIYYAKGLNRPSAYGRRATPFGRGIWQKIENGMQDT